VRLPRSTARRTALLLGLTGAGIGLAAVAVPGGALAVPASAGARVTVAGAPDLSWLDHPRSTVLPARTVATPAAAGHRALAVPAKLPTFAHNYTSGGKRYGYRMVGTDPLGAAVTTVIPDTITPLGLSIGGQGIAPSSSVIATVTGSGLFKPAAFPGGTGQYGNMFMRNQFRSWLTTKSGALKNWNLNLGTPSVRPQLTLTVPTDKGEIRLLHGVRVALVDVRWLDTALTGQVTAGSPAGFTQFLGVNTVMCEPYTTALTHCGIGGYHSVLDDLAGSHTYSVQSFLNGAVFGVKSGFVDTAPMSHELAEWLANPYLFNLTPGWRSPLAPQYGCAGDLEVGDPVVTSQIAVKGLHYQDEAFLWWFARSTSGAWLHRYTWFNALTTLSKACTVGA
jgi:hypothetical protein